MNYVYIKNIILMKYGSPKVSSNTIDVIDETLSPRKSIQPYVR
mgnify:CR=1 FL=1